jgi:fibrillarin-like pre-rRNA processing protein
MAGIYYRHIVFLNVMRYKTVMERLLRKGKELLTLNLVPGQRVYGEELRRIGGKEWRVWNPYRSKLAAALLKGLKHWVFEDRSSVLYLGASTGTTLSHLSDLMPHSQLFAVEISAVMMKELLRLAEHRENIIPILADANDPDDYAEVGKVDVIYQDVAQPNQAQILIKNASRFLKHGWAYMCVKTQSIDVVKDPREVLEEVEEELTKHGLEVVERINLHPYDKAHWFLVLRN